MGNVGLMQNPNKGPPQEGPKGSTELGDVVVPPASFTNKGEWRAMAEWCVKVETRGVEGSVAWLDSVVFVDPF